jgi:thiol-disulfide isomerase/thioredoxin
MLAGIPILFAPLLGVAAEHEPGWCAPAPEIADELTELRLLRADCRWEDGKAQQTCQQATRERILELAAAYPDDVVIQRLAQDWVALTDRDDAAGAVAFRDTSLKRLDQQANSAAARYLATRLRRPEPEEALECYRAALELDPDFPWSHYAVATTSQRLASEASRGGDTERATALEAAVVPHLEEFLRLCPDQLWEPLRIAPGYGGAKLWRTRMGHLREVLLASPPEIQTALSLELWSAESAVLGPVAFTELQEKIGEDLARIRAFDLRDHLEWWNTLIEGAKLAGDEPLLSKVLAELRKVAPCSGIVTYEDHQALREMGNSSDPNVVSKQLERLNQLVARCPKDFSFAMMRIGALWGVDELEDEMVIEIIEHTLEVYENSSVNGSLRPTPYFIAARELLRRDLEPQRALELARRTIEDTAAQVEEDLERYQDAPEEARQRWLTSISLQDAKNTRLLAEAQLVNGAPDEARASAALAHDALNGLADPEPTPRTAKQVDRVRAEVLRLEAAIDVATDRPANALARYLEASRLESEDGPSAADARALWRRLGGADNTFELVTAVPPPTAKDDTSQWQERDEPFVPFELIDITGATWTQDDLLGRTVLVNHWATWCGPCLIELPYLQQIHDRFSDREDVLVVTFNADSWNNARDPAWVLPFLKKKGYTLPVLFAEEYLRRVMDRISVPQTAIVDREGIVRWWKTGFSSRDADAWVTETVAKLESLAAPTSE